MASNKLLSICIPTFNRSEILDDTLEFLFSDPDFDPNKIEVLISDNCSNDFTNEVVNKYPLAIYYKNTENIFDKNFTKVLSLATGKYIKLFNDTLRFKPGKLKKMLDVIDDNLDKDTNIFFYMNMFNNKNCVKELSTKNSLINQVSYLITWIANFGIWKSDFDKIIDKDRYAHLNFLQVDWTIRTVDNKKKTIVIFDDFFEVNKVTNKGGYNLFKIFISNYLTVLRKFNFSIYHYEIEKFRLFIHFVIPWLLALYFDSSKKYDFRTDNFLNILLRKYWYCLYIYPILLLFIFKHLYKNFRLN